MATELQKANRQIAEHLGWDLEAEYVRSQHPSSSSHPACREGTRHQEGAYDVTAYFDETHEIIREAFGKGYDGYREQEQVECKLVFDCIVCSEMPGFPPELRERIHKVVLEKGARSQPIGAPGPEFESLEQHHDLIQSLCFDLHTIFHDVAMWARDNNAPFSDDPRMPLWVLYARGEEVMESLVAGKDSITSR